MRDPSVQKFLDSEETTLDPPVAGKRPSIDLAVSRQERLAANLGGGSQAL